MLDTAVTVIKLLKSLANASNDETLKEKLGRGLLMYLFTQCHCAGHRGCGVVAQLVERATPGEEVVGSTPAVANS